MVKTYMVAIAAIPLVTRFLALTIPEPFFESYNYWSAETLNLRAGEEVAKTLWRNMGYWERTDDFVDAAETLATKLLDFADAPKGGAVLDVGHGNGESLRVHLQSTPPPSYLYGLTSIYDEVIAARNLTNSIPHPDTIIEIFEMSASYRPGKDLYHPLNPTRNHLGRPQSRSGLGDEDDEDDEDEDDGDTVQRPVTAVNGPPPYDLIYVLDAIYHFRPSVNYFLTVSFQALRPGSGVIAYTDILPPTGSSSILNRYIISPFLSIPVRNLLDRPKDLEAYKAGVEKIGYEDVEVQDWSQHVWSGLAKNLESRGLLWRGVAWTIRAAERSGWKFIAVRAKKPVTKVSE